MIIVFDLDDTLYEEETFVSSGFRAVARDLERRHRIPEDTSFQMMWSTYQNQGRGKVFNHVLQAFGVYNKSRLRHCLWVYRTHRPDIRLSPSAAACIQRFEAVPKYIVTDGNKHVQRRKMRELGLYGEFSACIATYGYGLRNSKPSPDVFLRICAREGVEPGQVVYVGDNPRKDFIGIKPLGFRTIRVLTGPYACEPAPETHDAELSIHSLDELREPLLNNLFHSRGARR